MLLSKYDKQCHLYINRAQNIEKGIKTDLRLENRDEFLAGIIGQLIRLYAKSKTLSQCFQNFYILTYLTKLMQNEQFVISADAQKTFETIVKGTRIEINSDRGDCFIKWVEDNDEGSHTHELLNQMFYDMR